MRVSASYDANGQLVLLTGHINSSDRLSSPVSGKSAPHIGNATLTMSPHGGVSVSDAVGLYTEWA